jgi:hypothetical protein
MANYRTVDPTGKTRSTAIVALRLTDQMETIKQLCKKRGVSRSLLLRQLLAEESARVQGTR